jgi:hypothetical protein
MSNPVLNLPFIALWKVVCRRIICNCGSTVYAGSHSSQGWRKFRNVDGEHIEGGNVLLIKHPLRDVRHIENMTQCRVCRQTAAMVRETYHVDRNGAGRGGATNKMAECRRIWWHPSTIRRTMSAVAWCGTYQCNLQEGAKRWVESWIKRTSGSSTFDRERAARNGKL